MALHLPLPDLAEHPDETDDADEEVKATVTGRGGASGGGGGGAASAAAGGAGANAVDLSGAALLLEEQPQTEVEYHQHHEDHGSQHASEGPPANDGLYEAAFALGTSGAVLSMSDRSVQHFADGTTLSSLSRRVDGEQGGVDASPAGGSNDSPVAVNMPGVPQFRAGPLRGSAVAPGRGGPSPVPLSPARSSERTPRQHNSPARARLQSAFQKITAINRLTSPKKTRKDRRQTFNDEFDAGRIMVGTQGIAGRPRGSSAASPIPGSNRRANAFASLSPELSGRTSLTTKSLRASRRGVVTPLDTTGPSLHADASEHPLDTEHEDDKPVHVEKELSYFSKLGYKLEETLSRGKGQAVMLLVLAIVQVAFGAVILYFASDAADYETNFWESIWASWTYIADGGSQGIEVVWARRGIAFIISIGGMMFFAAVIGFVVDTIRARMDELKHGRSSVVEAGHVVILGWSDKSYALIRELCMAMKSEGGGVIVILSDRPKEQLEAEIAQQFTPKELLGTQIRCRRGSPLLVSDLSKVSAHSAKSIIILADNGNADQADATVLRIVLSLISMRQQLQGHVVAELRDIDNEGLVTVVGKGQVETIVSHDVIGRLMIKSARTPGLADAYEMLLGFEGDEFYFSAWKEVVGKRFGEVFLHTHGAVPVGIFRHNGDMVLNPPLGTVIEADDQIIFLAEDDDTYHLEAEPFEVTDDVGLPNYSPPIELPERILICGWRRDADDVVALLDSLVQPGSELHLLCEIGIQERIRRFEEGGLDVAQLLNMRLVHHVGNPSLRKHLEQLSLDAYNAVLIIADESLETDSLHADSSSLATLLLIRLLQQGAIAKGAKSTLRSAASGILPGAATLLSTTAEGKAEVAPPVQPHKPRRSFGVTYEEAEAMRRGSLEGSHRYRMSDSRKSDPRASATEVAYASAMQSAAIGSSDDGNVILNSMAFPASPSSLPRQERLPSITVESCVMCTELLDVRTRAVVEGNHVLSGLSDYILSNNIVSRVLAMVAERREVNIMLRELLGAEGQEVSVQSGAKYFEDKEMLSFWQVFLRARTYGEILLGYRDANGAMATNPKDKMELRVWRDTERLIVMRSTQADVVGRPKTARRSVNTTPNYWQQ